jgi:UDP-N-acetylmuramoyl-tripeptide--D-alanyl-D-alanine ligase
MSFDEAAASGAFHRISPAGAPGGNGFSSVAIDSRNVAPGALFVALAGEKTDGHRYLGAAFRAGARGALVSRAALEDPALGLLKLAEEAGAELLAAEDSLRGFQDLARRYLEKFPRLLRIGITGSSGKTTTKEIAAAIIGGEKAVVINPGNLNSETGLPLSVFNVRPNHEAGIFEMGMNRRGEIGELAAVLKPQIALVTNIGSAHIGILGTRGAIAEEKKAIFSCFTGKELALIPAGDEYRDFLARDLRGTARFYGAELFQELGGIRDRGLEGTEILWDGEAVRFGLPGRHNLANALAALAIARELSVGPAAVRRGLESVKPLFGRGEIFRGPVTVIRDCYNANPESAAAALAFCDGLDWPGRRIYVMGSMLELGAASPAEHRALGRRLAASQADMVYLFGAETAPAAGALGEEGKVPFFHTDTMGELAGALGKYLRPGDLVLLKGSRGCALEELSGALTGTMAGTGTEAAAPRGAPLAAAAGGGV